MGKKDKLDLANINRLDLIVDHRRVLVAGIVIVTVILAAFVPGMQTDPSLRSGIDTTSEAYLQYEKFTRVFGNEEFALVAISNEDRATTSAMLAGMEDVSRELASLDHVVEVVSLATVRLFQRRGESYGVHPVLRHKEDVTANTRTEGPVGDRQEGKPAPPAEVRLPEASRLAEMRRALPLMDLLLSKDHKTLGVLVRVDDQWRFDTEATKALDARIGQIVTAKTPRGTQYRIIGPAQVRNAIVRYNIQTGIIFGILCMLIGTIVSIYIFKSLRVTAITNVILGVCVVWVLGLMSLLKIPLNSTTALSFGFIPITTIEVVIHMVVRYHQFHKETLDTIGALKKTVRWLVRPCLICSATTAVGFGSLMVSSIPMVHQLGFIMSVGIMISCVLAMVLTPAFFATMKTMEAAESTGVVRDWLDGLLRFVEEAIFSYPRYFVALGIAITALLLAGAPLIRSDPQVLRMLSESTPEVQDIQCVEKRLTAVNSLELLVESGPNEFRKAAAWEKIKELEDRLKKIPEVAGIDSLLPMIYYMHGIIGGSSGEQTGLFSNPKVVPEVLTLLQMGADGERNTRRYLNDTFDKLHITVRIIDSPHIPIGKTIETVQAVSDAVLKGFAKPTVTGDLAVIATQAADLITDQVRSMFLAAFIITLLMMAQLGSPMLGLVCLIPNIPPVAAVFGVMGWLGISLDSVTVFAATVAVGLAADNTIHYLTQLKREININQEISVEECVRSAYRLTAKQIASWSVVTLLGFLALVASPFRPVTFFGALGCCSITLGLFGDLIFIQSLILSSAAIRKTIADLAARR